MKPRILFLVLTVFLVALIWFGYGFWRTYSGLLPAVLPPSQDIARFIEQVQTPTSTPLAPGTNGTAMPLVLPPGFSISIFAKGLGDPRVMIDGGGALLTSVPSRGEIVALPDDNHNGKADRTVVVLSGLNHPHGLALRWSGAAAKLYVAETNRITVYDFDPKALKATQGRKIADLPNGGEHITRTLQFLPDGRLLVSIGSSCNACHEADARRAGVLVMNADGSHVERFASGLRNAVFMAARPGTQEIWDTEMGRDYLGDDLPPDEINILQQGKDYGWPICYGKNIHDMVFDKNVYVRDPCADKQPSQIDLQAHAAPLGLAFVPSTGWQNDWAGDLIVAFHGSWNRSVPIGYKLVHVALDKQGKPLRIEDFITGWLTKSGQVLGRPAGVLFASDGSLLVSDDKAGVIYRIIHVGN